MPTCGWQGLLVRDLMTHPAITVPASASLHEAARLMTDHRLHRLVVVSRRNGTPVGVISESDIVREVAVLTQEEIDGPSPRAPRTKRGQSAHRRVPFATRGDVGERTPSNEPPVRRDRTRRIRVGV